MILKKPIFILTILSLVLTLLLAMPQAALAVPGVCPSNTTYIVKYDWNGPDDDGPDGWYLASGNKAGVVTVTGDAQTGTWVSAILISHVIISDGHAGGPGGPGEPIWVDWPVVPPDTSGEYDASWMLPPQNPPRDISNLVFCSDSFPVSLASFTAHASRGMVTIDWVTATEINTAGFILHRSMTADGSRVQVTQSLVAAQGNEVTGASYRITDAPGYGTFYYWLEDVDYSGQSGMHGAVVVKVLPAIRQLVDRPNMPGQ